MRCRMPKDETVPPEGDIHPPWKKETLMKEEVERQQQHKEEGCSSRRSGASLLMIRLETIDAVLKSPQADSEDC